MKFWKKIRRFFFGDVSAIGNEKHFPTNRKQRRAYASIERKRRSHDSVPRPKG